MSEAKCGTRAAYVAHVRAGEEPCEPCRLASAAAARDGIEARRERMANGEQPPGGHGNVSTYKNWGCRCDPCVEVHAEHQRRKYAEKVSK